MNVLNGYDGVFMTKIENVEMFVRMAGRMSTIIHLDNIIPINVEGLRPNKKRLLHEVNFYFQQ